MGYKRKPVPTDFKWRHFEPEIILLCVRWYLSYSLSYRDLVEMMNERGLLIAHTTIMRWVFRFSSALAYKVRPHLKKTSDSWRVDETYIKVQGKWVYLFRAINKYGQSVDFYLSRTRDHKAAIRFFERIIGSRKADVPRVINVDKNPAYQTAHRHLLAKGRFSGTKLRTVKYLNNIIEQDHRHIKRKTNAALGYKTFHTASNTIAGIETIHMLKKGRIYAALHDNPQLLRNFIHRLFDISGPIFPHFSNA